MNENTLIVTVGLPRSGKSTWARTQPYPIVNLDSIRLALHGSRFIQSAEPHVAAISRTMVSALFFAGHPTVIFDATNVARHRRNVWASPRWKLRFALVGTSPAECIRRAELENDQDIIPVIRRMANEWEDLTPEEMNGAIIV